MTNKLIANLHTQERDPFDEKNVAYYYDVHIEEVNENNDHITDEWETYYDKSQAEKRVADINKNLYNWKTLPERYEFEKKINKEYLEKYIDHAYDEVIREQAMEYFDSEDYKCEEQMQEIHENFIGEIESASPDDERENYLWDN